MIPHLLSRTLSALLPLPAQQMVSEVSPFPTECQLVLDPQIHHLSHPQYLDRLLPREDLTIIMKVVDIIGH